MTVQNLITSYREAGDRIANSAYEYQTVDLPLAGLSSFLIAAPFTGKFVHAFVTVGSLHNVTNSYLSFRLRNKNQSDALLIKTLDNDFGDGNDTAAYGKRDLIINTVAAALEVLEGETLELDVSVTGTLTADSKLVLVYDVD